MQHSCTAAAIAMILAAGLVAGCSKGEAATAPAAGRQSYEMVQVVRPESLADYLKIVHAQYDICIYSARAQKLPTKPFPQVPADYVLSRLVVKSDGKNFYRSEIQYNLQALVGSPETGCGGTIGGEPVTEVVYNGVRRSIEPVAPDDEPVPVETMPYNAKRAAGYTVPKNVGGVALKCIEPTHVLITSGTVSDSCIVDPLFGKVADDEGKPLLAYVRDLLNKPLYGTPLLHETQSLRVNVKHNPSVFASGK